MIEFALVLPVLASLGLGTITAGAAYDRKLTMADASNTASRFAATLPLTTYASTDDWLDDVHDLVVERTGSDLHAGTPGRRVCVAFVYPDGTGAEATRSRTVTDSDTPAYTPNPCFVDGLPNSEARVQISVARSDAIDVVAATFPVTISQDIAAPYQALD